MITIGVMGLTDRQETNLNEIELQARSNGMIYQNECKVILE